MYADAHSNFIYADITPSIFAEKMASPHVTLVLRLCLGMVDLKRQLAPFQDKTYEIRSSDKDETLELRAE